MTAPEPASTTQGEPVPAGEPSSLSPFGYPVFTVLWIATVVSNTGTWMQNAAAGWLMTGLDPDPFIVSMVQVATTLPMFLFALPAGALADLVDRRKLLVAVQISVIAVVAGLGLLVMLGRVTPILLLAFTFMTATAAALVAPAWQSIVPQLVPRAHLQPAIALNSVGINISRAAGPALAGIIISVFGLAAPFWLNAVSVLGVVGALVWWRSAGTRPARQLPPERFHLAIRAGLRHARHNPHLRATLIRAGGFFLFASAYWALLPLVARQQVAGGPALYGNLLGTIGVGAVAGAFALPWLKRRLGPDGLVVLGTLGTAVTLVLFGLARQPAMAFAASLIAGASWIAVLAMINVSAQLALPAWVRGRGLSIFGTVMFGTLSAGSAVWGKTAGLIGLPMTHLAAAAGALLTVPLLWRWKLQTAADLDLAPSMHWPEPLVSRDIGHNDGPVLVTVEYRIRPDDRDAFFGAMMALAVTRRRDGALQWDLYEDVAQKGRFVETFVVDSWIEHMRQHERVTRADHALQEEVNRFHHNGAPKVSHFIAANFRSGDQSLQKQETKARD